MEQNVGAEAVNVFGVHSQAISVARMHSDLLGTNPLCPSHALRLQLSEDLVDDSD